MSSSDKALQFVEEHDDFELIRDGTKARCTVTGQEFALRLDVMEEYVKSKSFLKAKGVGKKLDFKVDFSKYEPHIIQHKKFKNALFCQLTGANLNKIPAEVDKHISGRRYQRAKKEFEEMVANDEPVSEDEMDEEDDESDLSGVDEIDFTPAPKRRKIEGEEMEGDKEPSAEVKKAAPPTADVPPPHAGEAGEDKKAADHVPKKKLNKKQKLRAAAAKTDEEKKKETEQAAIAAANPETAAAKKYKTCAQKRKVNSKTRRKDRKKEKKAPVAEKDGA